MQQEQLAKLLLRLYKWLEIRPRSTAEVKVYLRKKLGEQEQAEVQNIIADLEKRGIIDDQLFVKWWIQSRAMYKPRSKRELQRELQQKGIDSELIAQALQDQVSVDDQEELLKNLVIKKRKQLARKHLGPVKEKQKIIEYLSRRGFVLSQILKVLSEN